jgi:hypothetical protein
MKAVGKRRSWQQHAWTDTKLRTPSRVKRRMNAQNNNDPGAKTLLQRLGRFPLRIFQLGQIMSLKDVFRVSLKSKNGEEACVHLSDTGRNVVFRRGRKFSGLRNTARHFRPIQR